MFIWGVRFHLHLKFWSQGLNLYFFMWESLVGNLGGFWSQFWIFFYAYVRGSFSLTLRFLISVFGNVVVHMWGICFHLHLDFWSQFLEMFLCMCEGFVFTYTLINNRVFSMLWIFISLCEDIRLENLVVFMGGVRFQSHLDLSSQVFCQFFISSLYTRLSLDLVHYNARYTRILIPGSKSNW